jgi:hypothetical protein
VKTLAKHELKLLAVWVPTNAGDERVLSLIGHKDAADAAANWKSMGEDADWKAAVAKANEPEKLAVGVSHFYMTLNDYSPALSMESAGERVFELRTYIATPNNLTALNNRFKNHTIELFKKHGMTNVGYFTLSDQEEATCTALLKALAGKGQEKAEVAENEPAKGHALVYFISHKSEEAAKESFGKFRVDEDWKKALKDSEAGAGGPLTVKQGVKSLFLKTVDFSPLK